MQQVCDLFHRFVIPLAPDICKLLVFPNPNVDLPNLQWLIHWIHWYIWCYDISTPFCFWNIDILQIIIIWLSCHIIAFHHRLHVTMHMQIHWIRDRYYLQNNTVDKLQCIVKNWVGIHKTEGASKANLQPFPSSNLFVQIG